MGVMTGKGELIWEEDELNDDGELNGQYLTGLKFSTTDTDSEVECLYVGQWNGSKMHGQGMMKCIGDYYPIQSIQFNFVQKCKE